MPLKSLLKKLKFIHTPWKPKSVSILEKIVFEVGHLIMKNRLSMLLTSKLLFVIKSFRLGFTSKVFLSFSRKTFFFWGSGMELIASNKRSCSLVRVLICLSSSSVDDNWSSGWIKFKFLSKSTEDKVSVFVSSSEVSMSKLFICSSIVGSRLRFLNFFFSLQYLLMWPGFPQL